MPLKALTAAGVAFARSMADRRFDDFVSHLSHDAVFFDEDSVPRGADAVAVSWKPLFASPEVPFSWSPDHVEVLPSGDLALSTGPVIVQGRVAGRVMAFELMTNRMTHAGRRSPEL